MPVESFCWDFRADPDEELQRWRVSVPAAKELRNTAAQSAACAVLQKEIMSVVENCPSTPPKRRGRDIDADFDDVMTPEAPRRLRAPREAASTELHQSSDGTDQTNEERDLKSRPSSSRPLKSTGVRVHISSDRVFGTVHRIMRSFAWVKPDFELDDDLDIHRGDVFLAFRDLSNKESKLIKGARVSFTLYCDDDGLGAENCQVELLPVPSL